MIGRIYKITNKINNKVYIGQTILSLKDRWYNHCSGIKGKDPKNLNMVIKKAIAKYKPENFIIELLEVCDRELLNERERFWISYYDSYKNGYNSTLGGQDKSKLPKLIDKTDDIIKLYQSGKSLRFISKQYNVDHATIKLILTQNDIKLRDTRTYKLSKLDRSEIIKLTNSGISRKEIMEKFNISKSYLSQLINGYRRI